MNLEPLIEALEKELAEYVRRGLAARAKQVEAELHRLGWSSGATPRDFVPAEPVGTTTEKPAKPARKPAKASNPEPAPKAPRRKN